MFPSTKGRNPQGSQWMSLNSRWSLRHADAAAASRKQGKQKHKTFKNLVETSAISESKVGRIDYLTHPVVNYKIYAAWTGTENANYVKNTQVVVSRNHWSSLQILAARKSSIKQLCVLDKLLEAIFRKYMNKSVPIINK